MNSTKITLQSIADQITNMEYNDSFEEAILNEAKEAGIVIAFVELKDLLSLRGALSHDVGLYGRGITHFNKKGLMESECDEGDRCPYYRSATLKATEIKAIWSPDEVDGQSRYSWLIETKVPHSNFEILEGESPYCRGIVFKLEDC